MYCAIILHVFVAIFIEKDTQLCPTNSTELSIYRNLITYKPQTNIYFLDYSFSHGSTQPTKLIEKTGDQCSLGRSDLLWTAEGISHVVLGVWQKLLSSLPSTCRYIELATKSDSNIAKARLIDGLVEHCWPLLWSFSQVYYFDYSYMFKCIREVIGIVACGTWAQATVTDCCVQLA